MAINENNKVTLTTLPEAETFKHESISSPPGRGTSRVKGEAVNTAALRESITFAFSKRTTKNRFMKAPMTERLCHWNKDGEDIV